MRDLQEPKGKATPPAPTASCSPSIWGEKQLFMAGSEQTIPAVLGEISIMATVLFLWAKSRGKTQLKMKGVNHCRSLQVLPLLLFLSFVSPKPHLSACASARLLLQPAPWALISSRIPEGISQGSLILSMC